VSYFRAQGKRHSDEIVAVKLDGSRTVERIARTHGTSKGCYRCEAHPAPSPDGRKVVFASNWAQEGGDGDDIKAYVVEIAQRTTTNLPARAPSAESTRHR
jgi:Tol biopolymer transport system component